MEIGRQYIDTDQYTRHDHYACHGLFSPLVTIWCFSTHLMYYKHMLIIPLFARPLCGY